MTPDAPPGGESRGELRARPEADADLLRELNQALLLSSLRADELAEQGATAEQEAAEARRMEGIGRLAGGIAHDFNNLLTVIVGHVALAEGSTGLGADMKAHLQSIGKAADRAATLTSQLLVFARKQVSDPKIANLNALIADLDNVLRRLVDGSVEIVIRPAASLGHVRIDAGQFGQLLMSLVVHARDAMPEGGRISIETANVELTELEARHLTNLSAGAHVLLAVSDDGQGMTAEMKAHAFEPFFTLSASGKGTGLELATCHGIVQQAGGHVELLSTPGEGTTIRILLPRVAVAAATVPPANAALSVDATEAVLLVEDEPNVRALASLVLRGRGYEVFEAADGEAALRVLAACPREIDIVVTDVVMPYMGGQELAERLGVAHPGLRVLFMSGYPLGGYLRHARFDQSLTFLAKPYTPSELARKVRDLLDAQPSDLGAGE